jgi:membrane-associated phospholipid phosphatase
LQDAAIDSTFVLIKPNSLQGKTKNNFGIAILLAIAIASITGIFILISGKNGSFLLINGNHDPFFDFFFKYYTHAGDGFMWVPLGLFCLFFRRKYFVAVLAAVILSTLLVQFLKRVVYPDELRPIVYLSENFPVHVIEGINMKRVHSFPSGHATTAFAIALLIAYMINKKIWSFVLPFFALLAGYSRVYLAQHFLTDVLAGMCAGIVSALLALMIYKEIFKRKTSA